jgi:two-component system chemotaxis response regulator CheB
MDHCEALIIGGSAGSLEVLIEVLPDIDPGLTFPIVIVLHRKPGKESMLTDLLSHKTKLKVKDIDEKEKMRGSSIYIAPPSYHLLIENDRSFSLDASEKVNFSRPSIDVTFESAAQVFKENLACLLLSGANSDGTVGMQKVKKYGGRTIIQNPQSAIVPFMPEYAMEHIVIDAILDPKEMANYINQLQK